MLDARCTFDEALGCMKNPFRAVSCVRFWMVILIQACSCDGKTLVSGPGSDAREKVTIQAS